MNVLSEQGTRDGNKRNLSVPTGLQSDSTLYIVSAAAYNLSGVLILTNASGWFGKSTTQCRKPSTRSCTLAPPDLR